MPYHEGLCPQIYLQVLSLFIPLHHAQMRNSDPMRPKKKKKLQLRVHGFSDFKTMCKLTEGLMAHSSASPSPHSIWSALSILLLLPPEPPKWPEYSTSGPFSKTSGLANIHGSRDSPGQAGMSKQASSHLHQSFSKQKSWASGKHTIFFYALHAK